MRQQNRPLAAELENSKHPGFLKNPAHPAAGHCFWHGSVPLLNPTILNLPQLYKP